MSFKIKLAKLWVVSILFLGSVLTVPVSAIVMSTDEHTITIASSSGSFLEGDCDDGGSCGM